MTFTLFVRWTRESFVPVVAVLTAVLVATWAVDDIAEQAADEVIVVQLSAGRAAWLLPDDGSALSEQPMDNADSEDNEPADGVVLRARAAADRGALEEGLAILEQAYRETPDRPQVAEALARMRLEAKNVEGAATVLETVLRAHPERATAHFLMGLTRTRLGEREAARAAYQEALVRRPSSYEAAYNLGLLLLDMDAPTDARVNLARAVESSGGQRKARALFALGVACARSDDKQGAMDAYRSAIEYWPDYLLPRFNLAVLLGHKQRAEAEAILDEAIALRADFAPAYFLKGRLASEAGEDQRALRMYKTCARLDPTLYKARYNMGIVALGLGKIAESRSSFESLATDFPTRAEPWFNLGRIEYRMSNYAAARADYERALEVAAGDYPEAQMNLALIDRAEHRLDDARARLQKLLAQHPNDASALLNLALVDKAAGNLDEALSSLERAIELRPRYAKAWFDLGRLHAKRKENDQAIAAYRKALEIDPKRVQAGINLGVALANGGDLNGAITAYDQTLAASPDYVLGYYNRGRAYGRKGEYEKAAADYQRAIELDPDHRAARQNLGIALGKLGKNDEAIAQFTEVLDRQPDNLKVRYNLAQRYRDQGNLPEARRVLEHCLMLDPDNDRCVTALALVLQDVGETEATRELLARRAQRKREAEARSPTPADPALAKELDSDEAGPDEPPDSADDE